LVLTLTPTEPLEKPPQVRFCVSGLGPENALPKAADAAKYIAARMPHRIHKFFIFDLCQVDGSMPSVKQYVGQEKMLNQT